MIRIEQPLLSRGRVLIACALLFVALMASVVTSKVWAAGTEDNASRSGKHVLTVYDGGEQKGVLTDAKTLGEALKQAGITLDSNDVTEPALDEKLVAANYDVNIYRARPVVVIDNGSRTKVMSPYRTAKQIATQAKLDLHNEDKVRIERSDDIVRDGALERLVIDRATPFTLVFYGKKTQSYTQATTVGEMLKEKGITPGAEDTVSVASNAPITAGMTIEIWRNGKQTVTEEEVIKKTVEEIKDANREPGYREVKTAGRDGKKNVTYEIEMRNGKEVSRKEVASVVVDQPTKEVVIVGAKTSGNPLTKAMGVKNFIDSKGIVHRETYYDLPMRVVMGNCNAGGVYTVRGDGAKIDKDGYIIVAANLSNYPRCSVVETSMGLGKVYDTGGFAATHPHGFDLATDWSKADGI